MKRCERRRFIKRKRRAERRQAIWRNIKAVIFPWPNLAYIVRRARPVFVVASGIILFVAVASLYPGYGYEQNSSSRSVPGSDQARAKSKKDVAGHNPHKPESISRSKKSAQGLIATSNSAEGSNSAGSSGSESSSAETSNPTENPPGTVPPDAATPEDEPPSADPPDNAARITKMVFAEEKEAGPTYDGKTTFSATSIYCIHIGATWKNIEGSHDQVIKVYCPDGGLYQTIYVPFTTHSLPSMTKTAAWSPRPVEIELVSMADGVYPVWGELPIAGTWAMRLPGTWSVKIYLDDNPTCLAQSAFTLNP